MEKCCHTLGCDEEAYYRFVDKTKNMETVLCTRHAERELLWLVCVNAVSTVAMLCKGKDDLMVINITKFGG